MSVDIEDIEEAPPPPDFPRANGAPMVMIDGKRVRHSRPSNVAKPLDDDSALTNWRIDVAAYGVAHDSALQARYVALDFENERHERKELREAAIQAGRGQERADIGTALHAMSVRWEQNDEFDPPSPYRESLAAYGNEMKRLRLRSVRFEQPCVNVGDEASGTFDRMYVSDGQLVTPDHQVHAPGTNFIGDLKTNKKLDYSWGAYAVQLAIYAGAQFYDVITETFLPTPEINQDWALLAWMPSDQPGECVMFWVDLAQGREGVALARQVREWRRNWRSGKYHGVVAEDARITDTEAIGLVTSELGAVEVDHDTSPEMGWLAEMATWAQERINVIGRNVEARTWLTHQWPDGVPTPKKGIEEITDMTKLLDHLDEVERRYEIPFTPQPGSSSGHHRTIHRGNTPPTQEEQ